MKARFHRITGKQYQITMSGISASHVRRAWDRPGSALIDVRECDSNGMPV